MNDAQDFLDPDNITSSEFRAEIKNWIEEQGIHANLQLQMKKDLIDQISRTAMGSSVGSKSTNQYQINFFFQNFRS